MQRKNVYSFQIQNINWSSRKTVPVGLLGLQYIIALVLEVTAFLMALISRENPSSSIKGTRTGLPEAKTTCCI